jgi:hypothetical protein
MHFIKDRSVKKRIKYIVIVRDSKMHQVFNALYYNCSEPNTVKNS